MKKSCLFFYKKYKCVCFIVHYTGFTLKVACTTLYLLRNAEYLMYLLNISHGKRSRFFSIYSDWLVFRD